ncbi:MAG: DUF3027 domain-containing protein [Chloroflexaceae bacterium]|nr:DUF3027 domain-containing protein [Chloroflexaceae bacterium]
MSKGPSLVNVREHFDTTHARWIQRGMYWDRDAPDAKDEWFGKQCMTCCYYVPLSGLFAGDWGACSNAHSPLDGTVRFEHDGCEAYNENEDYWNDT